MNARPPRTTGSADRPRRGFWRSRWLWGPITFLAGLVVVAVAALTISPWPGALVIRAIFEDNAKKMAEVMAPFAPSSGVTAVLDVQYAGGSKLAHGHFTELDVYYPTGTTKPLATIIWTHGGAWISGDKSNDRAYFEILASKGYTVIGLNYTYGPESTYPTAVEELNLAHKFIVANAAKYFVDPSRLILAGDSAGAQLTSQLAVMITDPSYARQMRITPGLQPSQVRGLVLNCGVYDLTTLLGAAGLLGWGDDVALWAYSGHKDLNVGSSPVLAQMSTINFVSSAFPASFISGGNADPLTAGNSVPMAARLKWLGVPVTTLFWPSNYTPALPHEYQFRLDLDAGQTALQQTLAFIASRVG